VFSFKLRGAYNKMAHLTPEERWKGVIACSAGGWLYELISYRQAI
jgi:threonine dehydratase